MCGPYLVIMLFGPYRGHDVAKASSSLSSSMVTTRFIALCIPCVLSWQQKSHILERNVNTWFQHQVVWIRGTHYVGQACERNERMQEVIAFPCQRE